MKKLLLATMAMLLFACSGSDDSFKGPGDIAQCDNIYKGNVELITQSEVDAFAAKNYCGIEGNLILGFANPGEYSDITDISGLSNLRFIKYGLMIYDCDELHTLEGLENLQSVAAINLSDNENLVTIQHLKSLTKIGSYDDKNTYFSATFNSRLVNLKGLEKVKNINKLHIQFNNELINLEGLEGLEKVYEIVVHGNNEMTTTGLNSLKTADRLIIYYNRKLLSLGSVMSLETFSEFIIDENESLTTLPKMPKLVNAGNLKIHKNVKLKSLEGFSNLKIAERISISDSPLITSLHGFENLTTVSAFGISNCSNITSLDALQNVTGIVESTNPDNGIVIQNIGAESLSGLQNITSFKGRLIIIYNENLKNFCEIQKIVPQTSLYEVHNNLHNPTKDDIIAGNCAQ